MHWEIHQPTLANSLESEEWPAFSTGFLYGYSVYTTFKLPLQDVWLKAHLSRLANNAKALGLEWSFSVDSLLELIPHHFHPETPVCRLSLIPKVESYGDFYQQTPIPGRLFLSLRTAPPKPLPISLKTVAYTRPLPEIKLGGIGELIFFKRQAQTEGFDDILLVNAQGDFCEASTANVFFICQGQLYSPQPTKNHCLPGITRLRVLEIAKALKMTVHETSLKPEALIRIDGAFLTNAVQGVIPVRRIDNISLPWPDCSTALLDQISPLIQ